MMFLKEIGNMSSYLIPSINEEVIHKQDRERPKSGEYDSIQQSKKNKTKQNKKPKTNNKQTKKH